MFDWATFLDVAEVLVTQVGGEAAERSAISRSYYACYGTAWRYANDQGAPLTRTGRDHQAVWRWFEAASNRNPSYRQVARDDRRLKQWRIAADYDDTNRGVLDISRNALATARQLLADLRSLP